MSQVAAKPKTILDIQKIRSDFPILLRKIHAMPDGRQGKQLVYFDNAATSQKPKQVIESISNYYMQSNANVHRGVHKLSEEATNAYEEARKKVANFVSAGDSRQIVFTRNATEAINLVAYSWGRANIKKGDEIVLTQMEHHSNLVPWQILAKEVGAKLKFIPIDHEGKLQIPNGRLQTFLTPKTKLVAITHASNVLGTINLVKQIIENIRGVSSAKILIDGAQAVPHMPVSIQSIKPDFYCFTGHKMLGPTGIGVMYAKKEILEKMEPFLGGGDMILEVGWQKSSWNYIPWKFEAGTPNIAGVIGLGAAVEYLSGLGMKNIRDHEKELTKYALNKLLEVKNLKIYGLTDPEKRSGPPATARHERTGVISFNIVDKKSSVAIHPHDLASILDSQGFATRSGHHCAQPLMGVLGVPATARVSFYIYNTKEEIDLLIPAIEKAKKIFKIN
jgi:cysteine desulfurase/selenocysteine lyase